MSVRYLIVTRSHLLILNFNTLSLYLIAGVYSISLSLAFMAIAHYQPGTRLLKRSATAMLTLSVGFTVSGFGSDLPLWITVVGTNMLLLAAGVMLFTGFASFCEGRPARFDRWGWSIVVCSALPFWYWGLVVPDGHYRAAVFSLSAAAIHVRTSVMLVRLAWQLVRSVPVWGLAVVFGALTVWMATRGVYSLLAEPTAPNLRAANPTSWVTVFWYMVFVTLMSIAVLWTELSQPIPDQRAVTRPSLHRLSPIEYFRHKLPLLWSTVLIIALGIVSLSSLFYVKYIGWEEDRLARNAEFANDAFVHHSLQVMTQVDTLLQAVRSFYLRTGSLAETEHFIKTLPFDKSTIDNLYLIGPDAKVLIPNTSQAMGRSLGARDFMQFHQTSPDDEIFIGPVEKGLVTEKLLFRVTRRISDRDGSFGGVVLATVTPESFGEYYRHLVAGTEHTVALLGTADRKFRARSPAPAVELWPIPVESPMWEALQYENSGSYKHVSPVDGVQRLFTYRKVGELPLVVVTGFSQADLFASVHERFRWLVVGVLLVLITVLVLAFLLTAEIHHRKEQNRFLSMLSHELKTPLSVFRIAVESEGNISETTRAYALQSVLDMDSIVERCLQVDRLENRGLVLNLQSCNLGETLADILAACQTPQRLNLQMSAVPVICTDAQMVRVVLNNLIDNALKYAATNSVVQVSALGYNHKRRPGVLLVVDNTPGATGMPDAKQIFKKYYRSPGAHNQTGSGLGLHLVKKLAEQLGGWVRYVPVSNKVRFELWLPAECSGLIFQIMAKFKPV